MLMLFCVIRFKDGGLDLEPTHTTLSPRRETKFKIATVTNTYTKDEIILLHKKLGHPSFVLLQNIYPSLFKKFPIDTFMCDACQLVKMKCTTYPLIGKRYNSPFKLIHCDIWGPSPQTDIEGHRWFLICVDDYICFCWLYLLKDKSETAKLLKNFNQY